MTDRLLPGPRPRPGVDRRRFLARAGLALGAGPLAAVPSRVPVAAQPKADLGDWAAVRAQFALAPDLVHMAGFFLAPHPAPVRAAIAEHRRGLDADPIGYHEVHNERLVVAALRAAGEYLGADPADVALTGSTTQGLGLLYSGLRLRPGQDILTTAHDHYATSASLRLRAERDGVPVRAVSLYGDPAAATREEMVGRLMAAIGPRTRAVAVTWVHSGTGVKLPIRTIADALAEANAGRAEDERALLCIDGVHGLGVEDIDVAGLGCDFFVAGCHKWLFGPRGTGLVWGRPGAWPAVAGTIPTFDGGAYRALAGGGDRVPPAAALTPGGFHAFEHRWALAAAFRFHLALGKGAVAARVHELNRRLKGGLAAMPHVRLRTPPAEELSSGIACFEVAGLAPEAAVARLRERGVVASVTPYATRYARLAPGLLTSEEDVEAAVAAVRDLGAG